MGRRNRITGWSSSWDEILADYPFLEGDDIRASLVFAAAQNDHVVLRAS